MSYKHQDRVVQTLQQIEKAILLLEEWNKSVCCADDYLLTPEGTRNLAASCMLVEAIGEAYKKIDAMTDGELLPLYPSIPWKAVKGIRDHIAHGYFDIDGDIVFDVVKNNLQELLLAIDYFLERTKPPLA